MRDEDRPIVEGALFTDQYQLSMAQVYFRAGLHDRRTRFDYAFRTYPDYGRHQAGYCVFAGIGWLVDWMTETRFTAGDVDLLHSQRDRLGNPHFGTRFLEWLEAEGNFDLIDVEAVAEGRIVHPYVPVASVEGPLAVAQILETSLLNHLNYPTLIATKASRVVESARGGPVLEFGMRRGPGMAVNAGARAALIGGADATSNVGISHVLGFTPAGTHAHSMVQAFIALGADELEAFRSFAEVYPDGCVLLVDTVDTLQSGVPNAITVFRELRDAGHTPRGIRLDSGDLAHLAIRSARMLDDAGFPDVSIVLSSDLDELVIWQILSQVEDEAERYGVDPGDLARRLVYGVGTKLITSHGHSALDGVYKLVAVEDAAGEWQPALKVSDSPEKMPIPGQKRLWRVHDARGAATADVVSLEDEIVTPGRELRLHHITRPDVERTLPGHEVAEIEPLLEPAWSEGRPQVDGSVEAARVRRLADLDRLDPGVRRLINPHVYHVSMTSRVKELRDGLVTELRA